MAHEKGYNTDYPWLAYSTFKELGELCNTMEDAMVSDTKEENAHLILMEFSDVMIYLLQLMNKFCPVLDLDNALKATIEHDRKTKKKTYQDGKIIRK